MTDVNNSQRFCGINKILQDQTRKNPSMSYRIMMLPSLQYLQKLDIHIKDLKNQN